MRIREATLGDLHGVVMGIIALRAETAFRMVPSTPATRAYAPSYAHIENKILEHLQKPTDHLWVADLDGAIIGLCGVEMTTQQFLPDIPYLQDWALWVRPEYRGTNVAKQLWKVACEWGARRGAKGTVRGTPTAKGERMTFELVEANA